MLGLFGYDLKCKGFSMKILRVRCWMINYFFSVWMEIEFVVKLNNINYKLHI